MSICEKVREHLATGVIEGGGEEIERHLDACATCAAWAADLARLQVLARELPRPDPPRRPLPELDAGPRRRIVPIAVIGAACAALAILSFLLVLDDPGHRRRPETKQAEEQVNLLTALDQAQEVWMSERQARWTWLDLPPASLDPSVALDMDLGHASSSLLESALSAGDDVTIKDDNARSNNRRRHHWR